jgi:nitrogen fixation protein FixH
MREWTGRDVLVVTVGAFGIIIAVNVTMAWKAISTFPGLEVPNSYAAGVGFDGRRAAQEALGWEVAPVWADGVLTLAFADAAGPVRPAALRVGMGRPTDRADDFTARLAWDGAAFSGPVPLGPGQWRIDVEAVAADGTAFSRKLRLVVWP